MRRRWSLVLLLALGCTPAEGSEEPAEHEAPETPAAQATWVETATIEKSSATLELVVPGEVEGSKEAILASSLGGYVESANVEVGDEVKKGDVLFRIDTALYSARLAQLEAELRASERELKRAKKLRGVIASSEADAAKDRFDNAKASIRVGKIEASRASIRAPFSGVIASADLEAGEVAGPGTAAARLVLLDPVKVTLSVPDRDVVGLEVGTAVEVYTDATAEPSEGKLVRINPAADIDTRAFMVDVEVPNPERTLLPGMIARVRIAQTIAEDKLVIPQNFIVTKRDSNGVFVVEDNVAHWRPLELGSLVRDQVVVEGGLAVGDNVVVVGQRALADGDELIISRQGRCCEGGRAMFGS